MGVDDDTGSVVENIDKSPDCLIVPVEDDSTVESDAEISDEQTIVDDHDYGFKNPGRDFGKSASGINSRDSGGQNIDVECAPCPPIEDVISRISKDKFEESEVESDYIERASNVVQEFSADDEQDESGDEFVACSAWSSLSLILDPQDQSPSKKKKNPPKKKKKKKKKKK